MEKINNDYQIILDSIETAVYNTLEDLGYDEKMAHDLIMQLNNDRQITAPIWSKVWSGLSAYTKKVQFTGKPKKSIYR